MAEYKIPISKTDYTKISVDANIKACDYGSHTFIFEFEPGYDKAVLKFKRADGCVIAVEIPNGTYTLSGSEIDIAGTVQCEISFYTGSSRITTNTFEFSVISDISTENTIGKDPKIPILDSLLKEVSQGETQRDESEQIRISNENLRISAENERSENESERISAENERETRFSEISEQFDNFDSRIKNLEEIKADKIINTASGTGIVLRDSASSNFKGIQIADETNTEVNVNIYGKNLFKFISPIIANGTVIETFENGAIVKGNQKDETNAAGAYTRGWFRSGLTASSAICPRLFEGQTVTISADVTLIEIGNSPNPYMMGILLSARAGGAYTDKTVSLNQTIGLKQKVSATYTITSKYSGQVFYPVFSVNSNTEKIENIQIEISDAVTEYEEYKNQSINLTLPLTDEQKEEFKTLQTYKPVTTILNDKNIEITVDYEVDTKAYIDNKFNELQNAIITLGGNE